MTSATTSTIEPELLGSKPRRIRLRNASRMRQDIGCFALFFLPFVLVGLLTLFHAIHASYVLLAGRTTFGQVVGYDEDDGNVILRYRFPFRGTEYTAEDRDSTITQLPHGSVIAVQFDPMLPGRDSRAFLPGASLPRANLISIDLGFAVAWNGILLLVFGVIGFAFRWQRHLYIHGEVAVGTIRKKIVSRDEGTSYQLKYEFAPLSVGLMPQPLQESVESVSEAEWNSVQEGEHVSVLYQPTKPRWNTLYRFGFYRIQDQGRKAEETSMSNGTVYDLIPGRRYRVRQDFKDYYQGAFTAEQILTFRHRNFLPYHGGHTIEFEERNLYLQEDANADILEALWSYLEPL